MRLRKLKFLSAILLFFQIANATANPKDEVVIAINNNNLEKVQSIIKTKNQANWEINKLSVLYYAAYGGHDLIADYLVEKGADILWNNGSDNSVLHAACHGCVGWLVEAILAKSTKRVNMPSSMHFPTPIEVAASSGCKTAVMQLLKTGKLKNVVGGLKNALVNGNYDVAQMIIDSIGLDGLLIDGLPPLYFAYKRVHATGAVQLLINNGIDINSSLDPDEPNGKTLFQTSIEERNPEIVNFCLRNGASFIYRFKYKDYGSTAEELFVLDLLFKRLYLGGYDSEEWIDVANLLID